MQRNRLSLVGLLLLLPIVLGFLGVVNEGGRAVGFALMGAVPFWIAAVVLFFAWPAIWRWQVKALGKRQLGMENPLVISGMKRYIFDESGVRFSGQYSGGYVLWAAVMRITSDADAVYLHVSQASAHVLPRRAFESEAAFSGAKELAVRLKG